jgi:hypothetical protein
MRTGPLASAWRKFDRGECHREALESELTSLADPARNRLFVHVDAQWEGKTIVRGQLWDRGVGIARFSDDVPRLSDDFPLILGDAVQSYRACLDHLVWALVKRFRVRLTPTQARRVQFPMHNSAREFEKMKADRTPGIPESPYRTLLKRYQPYRRGYRAQAIRWLRMLSETDEHRVVPVTVLSPDVINCTYTVGPGVWLRDTKLLIDRPVPFNPHTPFARLNLVAEPHTRVRAVQVEGNVSVLPVIYGRADALGAVNMIGTVVKEILSAFEELLN